MDDFSFDFTVYNKYNHVFSNDPAENTLIKCYLSEHQFSEDVNLTVEDIINILSLFLEEDEEVYVNSVRRKIYIKTKNGLETGLKDKLKQRGINLDQEVLAPIDIYNSKQAHNI